MGAVAAADQAADHELRFRPMSAEEPPLVFPCDACGRVDLNELSPQRRNDYFFARVFIGRRFFWPLVEPVVQPAVQ